MPERHSNLPAQRTTLIGRTREVTAVRRLIQHGNGRLVTLVGTGGAGKTSLALDVARSLVDEMPDGVWLVDLAQLDDAGGLELAACAALGLVDRTCSPEELLSEFLEPRQALLLLDNCEHLAAGVAATVDLWLDGCPYLHVLATSRLPLHVRGETVVIVPALRVPADDTSEKPATVSDLARVPAVRLFVERARAARADFALTAEYAPAVAAICRRLGGLPLAIEFAAAEVAALTPVEIEARLSLHQGLSGNDDRAGPTRQRTMETTLDWSYGLLDSREQALFRRLAIFAGPWTIEAAEQVCGSADGIAPAPGGPVSSGLLTLVEHSLVIREQGSGPTRFRFLAPVGEYAAGKLDMSGERDGIALAHARCYLALAARRHDGHVHAAPDDLERIAADYENCLAALRWAERTRAAPIAAGMAGALIEYWRVRGMLRTGLAHLELALALLGDETSRSREVVLLALANYHQLLGEHDRAIGEARAAVRVSEAIGDRVGLAAAFGIMGDVASDRGDFRGARVQYARVRALVDQEPNPVALGFWHANVGGIALREGNIDEAADLLERARTYFDEVSPVWYAGRVLTQLGGLARRRGDLDRASIVLIEALEWLRRYSARTEAIECLDELGSLALATGDSIRAATLFGAASGMRDSIGLTAEAGPPRPTADIDRTRELLAAPVFEEAWGHGRGLSLAECMMVATRSWMPMATGGRAPTGSAMTAREKEVAALVSLGLTNGELAERLGISTGTARIHIERILSKLGLTSRVQIATWFVRNSSGAAVGATRD